MWWYEVDFSEYLKGLRKMGENDRVEKDERNDI